MSETQAATTECYTILQTATRLQMSERWVKGQIREKKLKVVKLGRNTRIRACDLAAFLDSCGGNVGTPNVHGQAAENSEGAEIVETIVGAR